MPKPIPASEGLDALDGWEPEQFSIKPNPVQDARRSNKGRIRPATPRSAYVRGHAARRSKAPVTLAPVKLDGAQ